MQFREWNEIPEFMRNEKVRKYYSRLKKKRFSLLLKRFFDVALSVILLIVLFPIFLLVSVWIKIDSPGPAFYRQERVTQFGKIFRIFKFRTMVVDADQKGSLVTKQNDIRITKVGEKIRKYRIDEIPQLLNILTGDMSFVGTRPEVPKYVSAYTDEMKATLLLPAGVTSEASILFKNEEKLLNDEENIDTIYVNEVLPGKMYYNLKSIEQFSFLRDIKTMFKTVSAVIGKVYEADKAGEAEFASSIKKRSREV